MTYKDFEDLPVWQEAVKLYEQTDDFLEHSPPQLRLSFRDQLERAVPSISNNIAEGFERGTTKELLQFIYISRGSAGQIRSMLSLLCRRSWARHLESEISNLRSLAMSCSRQIRGWADSLQDSDIKGQRHLNTASSKRYEQKQRAAAQEEKLPAKLPPMDTLREIKSNELADCQI